MKISNQGLELIKHFESLHDGDLTKIGLQPKQDPIGIWTCGYGHALKDLKGNWLKGIEGYKMILELYPDLETITEEEALELLIEDLKPLELKITTLNLNLNQHEFDALCSFAFNLGFSALKNSTLLRIIKLNAKSSDIEFQFSRWNKAGGKVLPGLVRRRKSEATLYTTRELKFYD